MKTKEQRKTTLKGGEGRPYPPSRFAGVKVLSGSGVYRA